MKKSFVPTISHRVMSAALGPMSMAERTSGRYMRGPDGHPDGTPTPSPSPSPFSFPETIDSLDGVPAQARPLYVEKDDGKFHYDDISSLRSALEHERNNNKTTKGQLANLKKFGDLGVDADEIKQILSEREENKNKQMRDAGDFDSMKEQLVDNHNKELSTKDQRIANLTKHIEKIMVSDHAKTVLADADIQGNPTLLLPVIRDRVAVTETEDGDFQLVVRRADGKPMLNGKSEPASLKDMVMELRNSSDYAGAFKGVNQQGGGAPNIQGQGGGAPDGLTRRTMTVKQKTAYINEHGQAEYEKIPM
jgi:DNA-binding transcriptional MerR regulator